MNNSEEKSSCNDKDEENSDENFIVVNSDSDRNSNSNIIILKSNLDSPPSSLDKIDEEPQKRGKIG